MAATTKRLILFLAEVSRMGNTSPLPGAAVMEWRYDDLAGVNIAHRPPHTLADNNGVDRSGGAAVAMELVPHPGGGAFAADFRPGEETTPQARTYLVFSASPASAGLDGHAQFQSTFPQWLHEQIASGSHAVSAHRWAELQAAVTANQASGAAQRQRQQQSRSKTRFFAIRGAAAAILIGAVIGLCNVTGFGFERWQIYSRRVEVDPVNEGVHSAAQLERFAQIRRSKAMGGIIQMIGGGVGVLAVFAGGFGLFVWDRRRNWDRSGQSGAGS